jgi:hypothetical protein
MTGDERRTGPSDRHVDLDTLADLHAGGLDRTEAARVREHVAGCRQCAAALEALDAVQGQLRSLPAPAMPAAVAARLDAALAGLRLGRSASPQSPPGDPEDELALARGRRGRRLSRAIGAAAAAVVLLAAGGAIASIARGGGTGTTASSGAGSAASVPAKPQASGRLDQKSTDGGSVGNESLPGAQVVPPAYDRDSLRAALPAIPAPGAAAGIAGIRDPARRAACADSIPGATGSLRGVEHIAYLGQRAYVLVYADGARLTGYVVTEACGSTPGVPATVLDTVS